MPMRPDVSDPHSAGVKDGSCPLPQGLANEPVSSNKNISAFHHGTTAPSPAQNVLEAYFLPACCVTENYG